MEELEGPVIGIDLGTTYSCVAICRRGRAEIIENRHGNRTTPSRVAFTSTERLVGEAAEIQSHTNPLNTIYGVKRILGRKFQDLRCGTFFFKVIPDGENNPAIVVEYKGEERSFSPEEISSMILCFLKEAAEAYLGTAVKNAVITVPAYFDDSQRKSTRDAGTLAGLNVFRIIDEPTAAAIAYSTEITTTTERRNILVFDLGGGTFDVSILGTSAGAFQVTAVDGDTNLGGEDFDTNMMDFLVGEFKRKHKQDMSYNPQACSRLRSACEKAKRALSFSQEAEISVDRLHKDIDFQYRFTRAKFEELNMDLFLKCITIVERCLIDTKLKKGEIGEVVLVGGSTRIPKIQQLLIEFFDGKKEMISIPTSPDEAVACGAAILAYKLENRHENVTGLSLGVAYSSGAMAVIIPRNTKLPVKREVIYWNGYDEKSPHTAWLKLYEGERTMAEDNTFLGEIRLEGLPPGPAGMITYSLCFEVDAEGMLTVSAEHKESNRKAEIKVITNQKCRLEMERMVVDAEVHRQEDRKRMGMANSRELLEILITNLRIRLEISDVAKMMEVEEKGRIKEEIEAVSEWLEVNRDVEGREFDERVEKLRQRWDLACRSASSQSIAANQSRLSSLFSKFR